MRTGGGREGGDSPWVLEGFEFREGKNNAFAGGHARLLERCFSLSGSQVLYVGDHLFSDVNLAKRGLAWRTCLVLQELEGEMRGLDFWQHRENSYHNMQILLTELV